MSAVGELLACSSSKQAKIVMTKLCNNDSLSQMLSVMILATNVKNGLLVDVSSYVILVLIEYATLKRLLLPLVTWNEIVGWCCHHNIKHKSGPRKIVLVLMDYILRTRINLIFADIEAIINLLIIISLEEKDLNLAFISLKIVVQFVLDEGYIKFISPICISLHRFIITSNKVSFERCLSLIKIIVQSNLFNRQFSTQRSYNEVINILNSEIDLNSTFSINNDIQLADAEAKIYEKQFIIIFNKYVMSKLLLLWNDDHQVSTNPKVAAIMEYILYSYHLVVDPVLILNKQDKRLFNLNNKHFDLKYIANESSSIVTAYIELSFNRNALWLPNIFETVKYTSVEKIIETLDNYTLDQYFSQIIKEETESNNINFNKVLNLIALSLFTTSVAANQRLGSNILLQQLAELFSTFLRFIRDCTLSDPTIYLSLSIISWFKIVENTSLKLNTSDINILLGYTPLLMKNSITMPWVVRLAFLYTNGKLISHILHQIPVFLDNCYCDKGYIELITFIHIFTHVMRSNSNMIIKSNGMKVNDSISNGTTHFTITNYMIQQDTKEEMHNNLNLRLEKSVTANTIYHKYWNFFKELVKSNDFTTNIRVAALLCLVEYMKMSISFRDAMIPWLEHVLVSNVEHDESVYLHLQVLRSWSQLFDTYKSDIPIIALYHSITSTSKKAKILVTYVMKLLYLRITDESIRSNITNDYFLAISLPILKNYNDPDLEELAKLLLGRIVDYDPSIFMKIILHLCTTNPLLYAHEVNENGIESLLTCLFEFVNEIELSRVEVLLTQEAINNRNLNAAKILHFFNITEISKQNIEAFFDYDSVISENDKILHQILLKRVSKKRRN